MLSRMDSCYKNKTINRCVSQFPSPLLLLALVVFVEALPLAVCGRTSSSTARTITTPSSSSTSLSGSTTTAVTDAEDQEGETLSFVSGGIDLDGPNQDGMIPGMLQIYHSQSLKLTEPGYADPAISCRRGISYGEGKHQKMDVWSPVHPHRGNSEGSEGKAEEGKRKKQHLLPIVVNIHGGGWEIGYREYVGFMAQNLCWDHRQLQKSKASTDKNNSATTTPGTTHQKRPPPPQAVMVSPTYRLGLFQNQAWPESRDDIVKVLQWLQTNAEQFGGDPSRIVLAGHSAGGHLAACVGFGCFDGGDEEEKRRYQQLVRSTVKGLFLISCPMGLRAKDWFYPNRQRLYRWIVGPLFFNRLYRKRMLQMLRPIVGTDITGHNDDKDHRLRIAEEASPLAKLESLTNNEKKMLPFVHYSYSKDGDFGICRPHGKRIQRLLMQPGKHKKELNRCQVLAIPVDGHLESHFSLVDPNCAWYNDLSQFIETISLSDGKGH